ncbi:hypothetical protein C7999DRAFT_38529 [Corynascus novoguineensis]|uniref:Uncharacterized protein n=1 Tax=Corynascus novoguineensis TaxID=1126955 RepID=A0AAN7HHS6_9PEZI|nr:hypothetical protein C7999DRAFT_38529 [Corynascus novoguineensis]
MWAVGIQAAQKSPAPLPSVEEVEAQEDLAPKHFPGQHVVRVGEHFIVKHGWLKEDAEGRTCTYIVMEHLRGFLDKLRCLPSPDGFGSLDNSPLNDALFLTEEEQPSINGSVKTEAEIAEALVLKLERGDDKFPVERASCYRHVFPSMAGRYPRYWESATAIFGCGWWADDFRAWIPKFLDEYPNEYLWLGNTGTFLWY